MDEKTKQMYLRGYEDGLTQAWREIKKLATRYTGSELSIITNSKLATLYQDVDKKRAKLESNRTDPLAQAEQNMIHNAKGPFFPGVSRQREGNAPDIEGADRILIFEEGTASKAAAVFVNFQKKCRGLSITRHAPERLFSKYEPDVTYVCLAKSNSAQNEKNGFTFQLASPENLTNLMNIIITEVNQNNATVVFIQGVDYLITHNDPPLKVINFIQSLNEKARFGGFRLILSADKRSIDANTASLLSQEFPKVIG